MLKKDNLALGLIIGVLAPFLGMWIYYLLVFRSSMSFTDFLHVIKNQRSLLTAVSSLSLIANGVLFALFINLRKDITARGIFIVTLIYGIAVIVMKLTN